MKKDDVYKAHDVLSEEEAAKYLNISVEKLRKLTEDSRINTSYRSKPLPQSAKPDLPPDNPEKREYLFEDLMRLKRELKNESFTT